MEFTKGRVVCSKAGRDKGKFQVVIAVDGATVFVCDGKTHPLERPKPKNGKHLSFTAVLLTEETMTTNRKLQTALRAFADPAS